MKTDKQLKQEVEEELSWEPSVPAAHIGVSANNGVVQLDGRVGSFAEKYAAERAALRVADVKAVASEIKVILDAADTHTDEEIARAAMQSLKWNHLVPEGIKVQVSDGWLTLQGQAEWQYQVEEAGRAVRSLKGVKGVSNTIVIKPKASPREIVKGEIEKALRRSAALDAARIQVEAANGTVTLRGNVKSWAERDEAERASWSAPGVTRVEDLITVGYHGAEKGAPVD